MEDKTMIESWEESMNQELEQQSNFRFVASKGDKSTVKSDPESITSISEVVIITKIDVNTVSKKKQLTLFKQLDVKYAIASMINNYIKSIPIYELTKEIQAIDPDKTQSLTKTLSYVQFSRTSLIKKILELFTIFDSGTRLEEYNDMKNKMDVKIDTPKKQSKQANIRKYEIKNEVMLRKRREMDDKIDLIVAQCLSEINGTKSLLSESRLRMLLSSTYKKDCAIEESDKRFHDIEFALINHFAKHNDIVRFVEFYSSCSDPKITQHETFRSMYLKLGSDIERLEYCMTNVAIPPNSRKDITRGKIELYEWQKQCIWHFYSLLIDDNARNVIIPIPTSGGKTVVISMGVSFFPILELKLNTKYVMVYVAPNPAIVIQLAAFVTMSGATTRVSIMIPHMECVNKSKDTALICGTPNKLLQYFDMISDIAKQAQIILVCDEIHAKDIDYKIFVFKMSTITNKVLALSATLPNSDEVAMQFKYLFKREVIQIKTAERPVRQDTFLGTIYVHPWSGYNKDGNDLITGISPRALWDALKIFSTKKGSHVHTLSFTNYVNDLIRELSQIKLTLYECDKVTKQLKKLICDTKTIVSDYIPKITYRPPLNYLTLYEVICHALKLGPTLIFVSEDTETVRNIITTMHVNNIKEQYPYWFDLMDNIKYICDKRDAHIPFEYWNKSDADNEKNADRLADKEKSTKVKSSTDSKLASARKIVLELSQEWNNVISKLKKEHVNKYINKFATMKINELDSELEFPDEYKFSDSVLTCREFGWITHNKPTDSDIRAFKLGFFHLTELEDPKNHSVRNMIKILKVFAPPELKIRGLFTGPRLSMGMNVPALNSIIYDPDGKFSSSQIIQMMGRAGRKGIDVKGNNFLLIQNIDDLATQEYVSLF
jgi:hypothetical protein